MLVGSPNLTTRSRWSTSTTAPSSPVAARGRRVPRCGSSPTCRSPSWRCRRRRGTGCAPSAMRGCLRPTGTAPSAAAAPQRTAPATATATPASDASSLRGVTAPTATGTDDRPLYFMHPSNYYLFVTCYGFWNKFQFGAPSNAASNEPKLLAAGVLYPTTRAKCSGRRRWR